jgi:hypothetical protein
MPEILRNDFRGFLFWLCCAKTFVEFQEFSWPCFSYPTLIMLHYLLFPVLTINLFWWCIIRNDYTSILHARSQFFPNFLSVYSFYLIILRKTKNMGLSCHGIWVLLQIPKDPLSAPKKRNYRTSIWLSVNTRMDRFTIILFPEWSSVQNSISVV